MYKGFFKHSIGFIIALLLLLIVWPIILIVAICLYFSNKNAGIFFLQERPGKDSKEFKVIKFKTMNDSRGHDGTLLPDSERLTKIGKIIRKASLDELPQLLNVIKGDMSLIGPRPLLIEYLPLYSPEQARRHEVRPGMTGWAQVNGRNAISWEEKFKLDVWYVDNLSFLLDIKILFMTIRNVIARKGISKEGFATTEAFNGKN